MTAIPALLVFFGVFIIASLAVVAAAFWQNRKTPGPAATPPSTTDEIPLLLREETLSTITFWERLLKRFDVFETLQTHISEAGLRWSVGRVTATMMLSGTLAAAFITEFPAIPAGTSILVFLCGASIPYLVISSKRKSRFQKLEDQFPDALDSLTRALRAGHALAGGIEMLATEAPQPIGGEFRRTIEEYKLGMSWNRALLGLAERIPLLEVRLFVAAVLLQSRTGGKLTEVLEKLADTVRDSISLRGDVKAISAHGRLTGLILTLLPVGIAGTMYYSSPAYLEVLTKHPSGPFLIEAAICCLLLGHFVIKRIVTVKV